MSASVNYQITLSDYRAMWDALNRRKRYYHLREAFIWLLIAVNLAIPVWIVWMQGISDWRNWPGIIFMNLAIAIILIVFRLIIVRWVQTVYFNKQEFEGRDIQLVIDANGLQATMPNIDSLFKWDAIRDIDKTSDHIFFWINKIQAIILPLRAFENEKSRDGFLSYIRSREDK